MALLFFQDCYQLVFPIFQKETTHSQPGQIDATSWSLPTRGHGFLAIPRVVT